MQYNHKTKQPWAGLVKPTKNKMEKLTPVAAQTQSEFEGFFYTLRNEVVEANELATKVKAYLEKIKPFSEKEKEPSPLETQPNSMLDYFWVQVGALRNVNQELQNCVQHLRDLVGDQPL